MTTEDHKTELCLVYVWVICPSVLKLQTFYSFYVTLGDITLFIWHSFITLHKQCNYH